MRCVGRSGRLATGLAWFGVAVGCLGLGAASARADQGWWGDLDRGQSVRLADVLAAPEAHRGRVLTFACVFHRAEREFNPLRTRFNSERYDNFSAWPDGAALWVSRDYEQDFPFLYIARLHAQRDALLRSEMFTRIEVTARIEAVLDGHPFLEVLGWRPTGHRFGKDVWELMARGETYARSGEAEGQVLAESNFRRALELHPDLAPVYEARVRARLAESLKALGRTQEAEEVLAARGSRAGTASAVPPPATPLDAPATTLPGEEVGSPEGAPASHVPPPAPGAPAPPEPYVLPPVEPRPLVSDVPAVGGLPSDGGPVVPSLPGQEVDPAALRRPPAAAPGLRPAQGPARVAPGVRPPPNASSPVPAGAAPLTLPASEPAQPVVVDPPLPAPPPAGQPPPRKPRLAGVK